MNGFTCKTSAMAFLLLSTVVLSRHAFAGSTVKDEDKRPLPNSLGCMTCHQGESIQADTLSGKQEKQRRKIQMPDQA